MATVDNINVFETGNPHEESVRARLTGSTSTYVSRKFNAVQSFTFSIEGTNGATCARTGTTITITGTNDDWINFKIIGYK